MSCIVRLICVHHFMCRIVCLTCVYLIMSPIVRLTCVHLIMSCIVRLTCVHVVLQWGNLGRVMMQQLVVLTWLLYYLLQIFCASRLNACWMLICYLCIETSSALGALFLPHKKALAMATLWWRALNCVLWHTYQILPPFVQTSDEEGKDKHPWNLDAQG
jgi:hydrogenase-4 membrane subunit HyfE